MAARAKVNKKAAADCQPPKITALDALQDFIPLILPFIVLKVLQLPEDDMLLYSRSVFAIRTTVELCVFGIIYMRLQSAPEGPIVRAHENYIGFGKKELVPEMHQKDYDKHFFRPQAKTRLIKIVLLGFLHVEYDFVQPLLIFSIGNLWKMATNEPLKAVLFGRDVKRPFSNIWTPAAVEEEEREKPLFHSPNPTVSRMHGTLDHEETIQTGVFSAGNNSPLHIAAITGNVKEVDKLLAFRSSDLQAKNHKQYTPLHHAAIQGHAIVAQKLLAAGAGVDTKGYLDKTPLHEAAYHGHLAVVETLLAAGADKEARARDDGHTPLHFAVLNQHSAVVQMLLGAGANTDATTTGLCTPLYIASVRGYPAITRQLLGAGANIEARGICGATPLHIAAHSGHDEVVQVLLAAGAAINARQTDGKTPLETAQMRGFPQVVAMIQRAVKKKTKGSRLKECIVCKAQTSLRCKGCKEAAFCKEECVKIGWKAHKQSCCERRKKKNNSNP